MDSALLVAGSEKGRDLLRELLAEGDIGELLEADSRKTARSLTKNRGFDLIVINTPLPEEFGHELAVHYAASTDCPVLLFVRGELEAELTEKLSPYGIVVVGKPVNKAQFSKMLRYLVALHQRLLGVKGENERLQRKMEEMRLVDRAKLILMETLQLTEAAANRHIEKQAMDTRTPKRDIATAIIRKHDYAGEENS